MTRTRPEKKDRLLDDIKKCIDNGRYIVSVHAHKRQKERFISLPETLYVLKNGYEEKKKTKFDESYNTWKYAIRGKTKRDQADVRVVVTFDAEDMIIITVIQIG